MKAGFELFKTRRHDDRIDIAALEAQYNIQLPPLYKLFASTFHLDDYPPFTDQYYVPHLDQYRYTGDIAYLPLYDDEENRLHLLLDNIEYALRTHKNCFATEVEWQKFGFFRIGGIGMGGGLFVGTREENNDRIFRVRWDWPQEYDDICDNIFELVRGLTMIYDPNDPPAFISSYDQLYKNWGDEFWRIKTD
ncbi:MAG: hypothetical protein JO154_05425 [Chitinophaga sp.]|uniref:hypothetical protein n=1 Tax=Chitinophaga sp. TaxID=1869181 RepID=UPI0025C16C6E|nr:hypothetical protein [Chitinophaga sp.]MBV8252028.1 hypothetical protein [Chitinophaga sp.]